MLKTKTLVGCLLVFIMVVAPFTSVGAAAPVQTTNIDGSVESCETGTDNFTGETIVVCVITLPDDGGTRTIRLSVDDAVAKGLAVVEEDGTVTIIATEGQLVSIEEDLLLADPCEIPEDASQPISKLLADYFCGDLGTSYDVVQALHEDGFGFGVIAQACYMALKLEGTGMFCADILYAKKSGDYSQLTLPDGVSVSNWGQLRKTVLDHDKKANLGSIVSDTKKNENAQNEKEKVKEKEEKNNGKPEKEHDKAKK